MPIATPDRSPSASGRPPFWLALSIILAVATLAYWHGLNGVFLFDDFANLPALGAQGPVDNWTAFWTYITSGTADPTGRPLALLSFLIDAHNWPADPYPFKRTSLVLHLINGALLALLLRRLGRAYFGTSRRGLDLAAVLGSALWLLHPLFVSTTLYVVQREAMLPATFVLLGLLGYCRGRELVGHGHPRGIWSCAMVIGVATMFAVLSKANGVLLPLLAWLVEYLLLAPAQPIPAGLQDRFKWMRRVVLVLPSLIVLAWLAEQGVHFILHGVSAFRPWTLGERLLTESRIVCDYLRLLWLPRPYTAGLFNDAVTLSRSLVDPPTTLAAITFLGALLGTAIALRRRAPVIALAVLFFFAGQLLESTVVPLELYYEHRNYLPAVLMFWPLALWLTGDGQVVAVRRLLAVALPIMLAGMTFLAADLWGNAQDQALLWAEMNPDSPRAQAYAAAAERARDRPDLATARMQRVHVAQAETIQIALNEVGAQCELGTVGAQTLERAQEALRMSRTAGRLYYEWMSEAIDRVKQKNSCAGLGAAEIESLLDAMDNNANMHIRGWRQDNFGLRGRLALALGKPGDALDYFNRALDVAPQAAAALAQAAMLGSAGYAAEGLAHLDHFETLPKPAPEWTWSMAGLHAWLLRRQGYEQKEIAHLRGVLEEDVRDAAKAKS